MSGAMKAVSGLLFLALAGGCAATYTAPDFGEYAARHRTIAVLPFDVTEGSANLRKDIDPGDLTAEAKRQSETFQRALYVRFLLGQERGRYSVTFQDVDETNARLRGRDVVSKAAVAEVLGVDAVISGRIALATHMDALASALLLGVGSTDLSSLGSANEAHISMAVHDGTSGSLLWTYEHEVRGGVFRSPEGLAKNLLKRVESKFPYRQR